MSGRAGQTAAGSRGPWLAFAGCVGIWGSTFLFISIGNDALAPVWAAALRLAIAAPVLVLLTRLTGASLPRGAALRAAAGYGVLQFGINFPLLYWGEKSIPSGLAAVLYATIPLSSALITRAFGMERLVPMKLLGALIALGGVAVIGGGLHGGRAALPGLAAVLAAATLSALGTVILKRGPRQSPFGANAVACVAGLALCLPLSALLREPWIAPPTPAAWTSLLYLALAGSAGAFALLAWLVHQWPVTRVAFISVLTPVVATALGALVRHEPLSSASVGGSALVLVGLVIGMAADRSLRPPIPARSPR